MGVILLIFNNFLLPVIYDYFTFLPLSSPLVFHGLHHTIYCSDVRFPQTPAPPSLPVPSHTWSLGLTASSLHSWVEPTVSWMFSSLLIRFLILLEHTLK